MKKKLILTSIFLFIIIIVLSSIGSAGWYYNNYEFRKNITFENNTFSENDVPVKLVLDEYNFNFQNITSKSQFRFTYKNSSGLEESIPYYFTIFKPENNNIVVYFKIPILNNNSIVYMYYSNNDTNKTDISSCENTFYYCEDFTNGINHSDFIVYSSNYSINSSGLRLNTGYTRLNNSLNFNLNDNFFVYTKMALLSEETSSISGFYLSSSPYTASANSNSDFTILLGFNNGGSVGSWIGNGKTNSYNIANNDFLNYYSYNTSIIYELFINNTKTDVYQDYNYLKSYFLNLDENFNDWFNTSYKQRSKINVYNDGSYNSDILVLDLNLSNYNVKNSCSDVLFVYNNSSVSYFFDECKSSGITTFYLNINNLNVGNNSIYFYTNNLYDDVVNNDYSIFSFFENAENLSDWTNHSSGYIEKSNNRVFSGNYSIHKDGNNDPNGATTSLNFTIDRSYVLEGYVNRNSNYLGGQADRVGIINNDGDGYGFIMRHGNDKDFGVDKRNNYAGAIYTTSSSEDIMDYWYKFKLYFNNNDVCVKVYKNNNLKDNYCRTDNTYNTFNKVYVFGGYDYYVDNLKLYKKNVGLNITIEEKQDYYVVKNLSYYYFGSFIASNNNNPSYNGDDLLVEYFYVLKSNETIPYNISSSEYIGGEYKELYIKLKDEEVNVFLDNFTLTLNPNNNQSSKNYSSNNNIYLLLNSYDDFNLSTTYNIRIERYGYNPVIFNNFNFSNYDYEIVFNTTRIKTSSGGGGGGNNYVISQNNGEKIVYSDTLEFGRIDVYPFVSKKVVVKYAPIHYNASSGEVLTFKIDADRTSKKLYKHVYFENKMKTISLNYDDFFKLSFYINILEENFDKGIYDLYINVYNDDDEYVETIHYVVVVKDSILSVLSSLASVKLFTFGILNYNLTITILHLFIFVSIFGITFFVGESFLKQKSYKVNLEFKR